MRRLWALAVLGTACLAPHNAFATEIVKFDDLQVSVAGGMVTGKAHELIYNEDGSKLSKLDWNMQANPTITGRAEFHATPRVSFEALATVGLNGNNKMNDYDWQWSDTADWTDHSWHPDTKLDHYVSLNFAGRYDFYKKDADALGLIGGFKYTDAKWTARGGCFTYTDVDFRDTSDCFADGEKGISYRQKLPAAFAGLGFTHDGEQFDFGLSAVAGVSIEPRDRDNHWMRDLLYIDKMRTAPYLGLTANASYALSDQLSLTFLADFARYFTAKGTERAIDTTTGLADFYDYDAVGANLTAINLAIGLTYRF